MWFRIHLPSERQRGSSVVFAGKSLKSRFSPVAGTQRQLEGRTPGIRPPQRTQRKQLTVAVEYLVNVERAARSACAIIFAGSQPAVAVLDGVTLWTGAVAVYAFGSGWRVSSSPFTRHCLRFWKPDASPRPIGVSKPIFRLLFSSRSALRQIREKNGINGNREHLGTSGLVALLSFRLDSVTPVAYQM
jgi:hypothetical protein